MYFIAALLIGKTSTILIYTAQDSSVSTTGVRFHRSGIFFFATLSRLAVVLSHPSFSPCLTKMKLWRHEADSQSSSAEIKEWRHA